MMRVNLAAIAIVLALAITVHAEADEIASTQSETELAQQISRLVQQLDDDRAAQRDAAESKLLELAGTTADEIDRFLELLPEENDQMPLGVRDRLTSIRELVEDRVAKAAVISTKITLSANKMPLAEVFAAIEKQTGNRLADNRQGDSPDAAAMSGNVTIELTDEPFWPAVDQILDQLGLSVYNYGGMDALSLVSRPEYEGKRYGTAVYSGPLRFEVLELQSQRNLRQPDRKSLKVQLEVAWEPRLRPIALSQPVDDVSATTDKGATLSVSQPDAVMDVEVPDGTQAAEIILPFELPARDATKLASLKGRLRALVPGRQVKFEFSDLARAAGKTQRRGGVQVTLDDVRKNNAIWEVHMRMALDEANSALESHRGWVFQNKSYLVGADGEPIENVGLETTRQSRNEVGVAYLFDLPSGINGLTWVYETPAAIVELPVEYEIKDIELP
jgi:hypothetical protein